MPQAAAAQQGFNPATVIDRAKNLEAQRANLGRQISKNRELLRLMEENGLLTDEQADWLDDFYPEKERGARRSKEDIERTRRAKEQARKQATEQAA